MDERYDRAVSNLPPLPSTPSPPPWPPTAPSMPKGRRPRFVILAIALVVVTGIAIAGWFLPLPENKPSASSPAPKYTDEQVSDAKSKVCAAYEKVHHAVLVASARNGGSDPTAQLAVATAVRQALDVGRGYLLTTLAEEPASPPDLAAAVRKLAGLFEVLAVDYLAEVGDSELEPSLRASDDTTVTIEGLCK